MAIAVDTRPLRLAPFRRLWLASVVTAIGGQFSFIAVPKQLYDLTGSSGYVGIAGAVTFCCLGAAALWGGAFADAVDRRLVLLFTSTGIAVTAVLFWALFDLASVPVMLALIGIQAAFVGANLSAMGAAIPRLVPTDLLAAASSLGALVRSLGPLVSPLLAGLLMPVTGLRWLYLADAIALTATIWAIWRLPPIQPGSPSAGQRRKGRAGLRDIISGFRYLAAQPVLLAVLAVDLSAMVFGFPIALYPEIATSDFGLGLLYAGYPAGVVLMGLVSGIFTKFTRYGAVVTWAVIAWGATLVGFGLTASLTIGVVFLIAGGAANFLLTTFRNAITQAYATDEMRGRTQGALTVILMGGPALANLVHGLASVAIGPQWTIAVGGVLVIVSAAAVARRAPAFWRYTPPHPPPAREAPNGAQLPVPKARLAGETQSGSRAIP